MKKINIILSNAPITNDPNLGCRALTLSALYLIDDVLKKKGIEYNIYLTCSGYPEGEEHIVHIADKEIKIISCYLPFKLSFKQLFKKAIRYVLHGTYTRRFNPYKIADYVLDTGYGDSFADIYGTDQFKFVDITHKFARQYNIKYGLLPQTIGPYNIDNNKIEATNSINNASMVLARDKSSRLYAEMLTNSNKEITEILDMAFFMPFNRINLAEEGVVNIGLGISDLLWLEGDAPISDSTAKGNFGLVSDYKEITKIIIDYFLSLSNVRIHLVPHVISSNKDEGHDYALSEIIWNRYNNPRLILSPFFFGPIEAKSYISGLDFFVGARMHATIAAFSTGVPVVPLAYSRKFNGLFEDTLNYHHIADMKIHSSYELLDIIKVAYNNRINLKEIIEDRNRTIVKKKKEMLKLKWKK